MQSNIFVVHTTCTCMEVILEFCNVTRIFNTLYRVWNIHNAYQHVLGRSFVQCFSFVLKVLYKVHL